MCWSSKRDNFEIYTNFVTWYFCFPHKSMQKETLVSLKHTEDMLVFSFTTGDKWKKVKYLRSNGREMTWQTHYCKLKTADDICWTNQGVISKL